MGASKCLRPAGNTAAMNRWALLRNPLDTDNVEASVIQRPQHNSAVRVDPDGRVCRHETGSPPVAQLEPA